MNFWRYSEFFSAGYRLLSIPLLLVLSLKSESFHSARLSFSWRCLAPVLVDILHPWKMRNVLQLISLSIRCETTAKPHLNVWKKISLPCASSASPSSSILIIIARQAYQMLHSNVGSTYTTIQLPVHISSVAMRLSANGLTMQTSNQTLMLLVQNGYLQTPLAELFILFKFVCRDTLTLFRLNMYLYQ